MTEHPITPPPELVKQWRSEPEYSDGHHKITMVTMSQDRLMEICEKSALHGADQELEACCVLMDKWDLGGPDLRECRRPKPPSLKEQALETLKYPKDFWSEAEVDTIRLALEQLDD
jgi:hypothetical protein